MLNSQLIFPARRGTITEEREKYISSKNRKGIAVERGKGNEQMQVLREENRGKNDILQ